MKIAQIFDAGKKSRSDLRDFGRSLREQSPLDKHGEWIPADNRPDPVEILRAQEGVRLPELIPIRYGRMAESPFRFFRGAAAIMAWDLAQSSSSGVNVQACGDAHVLNFGMYASPERRVVFDINDFDETLPAPWEFDVKRLAASIVLDCREADFSEEFCREAVWTSIGRYCSAMRKLAEVSSLDIHYAIVDEHSYFDTDRDKKVRKYAEKGIKAARRRTRHQAFRKWCTDADGELQFVEDPPLVTRLSDEKVERIHEVFNQYRSTLQSDREHVLRQYRFRDAAQRVVGVGSVGLGAFVVLLEGLGNDDPLIIQIKQVTSSVLSEYVGTSGFDNHGQRVVSGQRLMQAASDPFLGWAKVENNDYYLRQLRDMKGKVEVPSDPELYLADVEITGSTLARAHARSVDPGFFAGYLGEGEQFTDRIASFAVEYADQAERDHADLLAAIHAGKISADRGI